MKRIVYILFIIMITIFLNGCSKEDENDQYVKDFLNNPDICHNFNELASLDIDKTFNYDDLDKTLKNSGFRIDEINKILGDRKTFDDELRYVIIKLDTYTYDDKYILEPIILVGLKYVEDSTPNKIITIKNAHLFTIGDDFIFNGSFIYDLESDNSIYYSFYGDLYEDGILDIINIDTNYIKYQVNDAKGNIKNISEAGHLYFKN